jgi:hypothetical protein
MEMNSVYVEAKARTGKSIKVGDDWYGAFSASQLDGVEKGDTVTFTYTVTEKGDKTYKNIKGNVKKEAGASTPVSASSSGGGKSSGGGWVVKEFPVPPLHPDRSIIRQNSLTHAGKVVEMFGHDGLDSPDELAQAIVEIARIFEAYSTGESDKEAAEAEVKKMLASDHD